MMTDINKKLNAIQTQRNDAWKKYDEDKKTCPKANVPKLRIAFQEKMHQMEYEADEIIRSAIRQQYPMLTEAMVSCCMRTAYDNANGCGDYETFVQADIAARFTANILNLAKEAN